MNHPHDGHAESAQHSSPLLVFFSSPWLVFFTNKIGERFFSRIARLVLLSGFYFFFCPYTFAQHPLVGTWEMVSIKGINVDGELFFVDTTAVRETKIITPTHYILIARDVRGDSLVFNRAYAGKIKLEGNHYNEIPTQASVQIFDNVRTDFTWKVQGDTFTQSGTFTRPDGKTITLEAMVFRRVKSAHRYPRNPAIGAWSQLSSSYTNFDGTKDSHTNKTTTRFHMITPTHWMRISHRDGKFEHAMGGTYTQRNGKTFPIITYSSSYFAPVKTMELIEKVDGDKLHVQGEMIALDGKKFTWDDLFERVH